MGRAQRTGVGEKKARELTKLLTATRIPSLPEAILSGKVTFGELWRLRDSSRGQEFRAWFNAALDKADHKDIRDAYIELLAHENWASSLPVKVLRFVVSAAAGLLNPSAAIAIGAADASLDSALKDWSPKLFLDDLRRATTKHQNRPKPVPKPPGLG